MRNVFNIIHHVRTSVGGDNFYPVSDDVNAAVVGHTDFKVACWFMSACLLFACVLLFVVRSKYKRIEVFSMCHVDCFVHFLSVNVRIL